MGGEVLWDLGAKPGRVDEHLTHPRVCQVLKMPGDQGLTVDAQERLGGVVAQGSHAFTPTCTKHQSLGQKGLGRRVMHGGENQLDKNTKDLVRMPRLDNVGHLNAGLGLAGTKNRLSSLLLDS